MLIAIPLPEQLTKGMSEGRLTDYLYPLSRVNLLCGPNNSGKSRVLREILKQVAAHEHLLLPKSPELGGDWVNSGNSLTEFHNTLVAKNGVGNRCLSPDEREKLFGNNSSANITNNEEAWSFGVRLKCIRGIEQSLIEGANKGWINKNPVAKVNNILKGPHIPVKSRSCAYVPTTRTCRSVGSNESVRESLKNDYFSSRWDSPWKFEDVIFQGLDLNDRILKCLLGPPKDRKRVANFEKFLSHWFFDGMECSLIPGNGREVKEDRKTLEIRIEPEKQYPISQLGDGLQHILIQLAPLFLLEGEHLCIFIEEPELYLHPGYQRRLMEAFLSDDAKGSWKSIQIFAATHSNHLLDMTLDHSEISIFRISKHLDYDPANEQNCDIRDIVEKQPELHINYVSGPERRLLEDLGVLDSSVFLTNCSIWVEGPHDRTIIKHYLELYMNDKDREFQEDLHYSFVFYGGSLLARWNWLEDDGPDAERLCGNILLVADRDEPKMRVKRDSKLIDILKERYIKLSCREIENTVSETILKRIIATDQSMKPDELLEITLKDLKDEYMGTVIKKLLPNGKTSHPRYGEPDKTIGNKPWFARKLVEYTSSVSDMSEEAKLIANELYDFVEKNNQNLTK